MKRLILIGLLVKAMLFAGAQDITGPYLNMTDNQGRKQGKWQAFDEEGNLKFTGKYIDGIPVGVFNYFYQQGEKKATLSFSDSGRVAYAKNYHPSGLLMAEGKYLNQKKDSIWLYYSAEDGTLSSEEKYVNTIEDGVWRTYYPDGGVAEEVIYKNGVKEGPYIQYFTDGKVKMKTAYINDELEGQYLIYHLNGTVEVSGTFINSLKSGTWVYFDDAGMMEKREEYHNGNLVSQEIFIEEEEYE